MNTTQTNKPMIILLTTAVTWCLAVGASLATEPGMHGRVMETTKEGRFVSLIAGATVEFLDESGGVAATATSGENGYYKTLLAPGRYYFRVTAEGFREENSGRGCEHARQDGYSVQCFALVRDETSVDEEPTPDCDAELPWDTCDGVGMLFGQVQTKTDDGQLVPVPGAMILLRQIGTTELRKIRTTRSTQGERSAGSYRRVFPAGPWQASAVAPGFQRCVITEPITVEKQEQTQQDFLLERSVPSTPKDQGIRGIVGLLGEKDPAVKPQIKVFCRALKASAPYLRRLDLGSSGKFSQAFPDGVYRLAATAPGYRAAYSHPVLVNDSGYATVRLALEPIKRAPNPPEPTKLVAEVSGADATTRSIHPLPGAEVTLQRMDENKPDTAAAPAIGRHCDKSGKVMFEELQPGPYRIEAKHEGFESREVTIDITARDENHKSIVLHSKSGPDVPQVPDLETPETPPVQLATGYVVYRDSQGKAYGVPGAEVIFGSGEYRATSKELGRFELPVPDGVHRVTPQPPKGYRGSEQTVTVRGGKLIQYVYLTKLQEPPKTGLQLIVHDAADRNRILAGARVSVSGSHGTVTASFSLGANRHHVALAPGSYEVRVVHGGYQGQTFPIVVGSSQPTSRTVGLQRLASPPFDPDPPQPALLTVSVYSTGGEFGTLALSGATVAISQNGRPVAMHQTAVNGSVTAQLPSPGSYQVSVSRAGYQSSMKTVSVRGSSQETFYLRSSTPPTQPASLTVRVQSTGGEFGTLALSGATVAISQNGRPVATHQTAANGSVTAQLPSPGLYQVSVSRAGYQSSTKTVSVLTSSQEVFSLNSSTWQPPRPPQRDSHSTLFQGAPLKGSDTNRLGWPTTAAWPKPNVPTNGFPWVKPKPGPPTKGSVKSNFGGHPWVNPNLGPPTKGPVNPSFQGFPWGKSGTASVKAPPKKASPRNVPLRGPF
jgi:hypothetical protein